MPPFKDVLYVSTIAVLISLSFYEFRLQRELTDDAIQQGESGNDLSTLNELSGQLRRHRALEQLPREPRSKLRTLANLKLLFVVLLVIEVIVLQMKA